MNLYWAALIVAGVATVAITAMLLVRRRSPEGSYFEDGDRAAGVFGVLATGFAVLLGFVVFLAFQSFDTSRSGAETEAQIIVQEFETAQLCPPPSVAVSRASSSATPGRSCTRSGREWRPARLSDGYNPWGVAMFHTLKTLEPTLGVRTGRVRQVARPAH